MLSVVLIVAGGIIGYMLASKVEMTQMPELVAGMHALVGLAAVFVGYNAHIEIVRVMAMDDTARKALEGFAALIAKKSSVEISIHVSNCSWVSLSVRSHSQGRSLPMENCLVASYQRYPPGGHMLNAAAAVISAVTLVMYMNSGDMLPLVIMTVAALFIGYHLIMGIGGADMPVVVSMLNSYSGWAAAAIGFSLGNDLLIVVGALVGSLARSCPTSCVRL